jgi:repressor LexA
MLHELTAEQNRVFSFIVRHRAETGFPPTVREIAEKLGYKSPNNVRQHLRLIEQKGYIRVLAGKARGIEVLVAVQDYGDQEEEEGVPLVGSVAAGRPLTAVENISGYVKLDRTIFKGEGLFALRIKGDSMTGMGILNGDIVVVRQKQYAENGEVVVVIIDGEATLKRFFKYSDRVVLHPENSSYEDMVFSSNNLIQIAGKLVGVIRKY